MVSKDTMRGQARIVASLLSLFGCNVSAGAATIGYQDLSIQGLHGETVSGINDAGTIVGEAPGGTAFTYTSGGLLTTFLPAGFSNALALGINSQGQVVGGGSDTSSGTYQGYLYDQGVTTVLSVPSSTSTEAWGLNDTGTIVGTYGYGSNSVGGFVYSGGAYTTYTNDAGDLTILGVNDSGTVVGSAPETGQYAGFTLQNGTTTYFDTFNAITGIDSQGDVVGNAFDALTCPSGLSCGFYLSDGTYTAISVPGAQQTTVSGVNDSGQIVGMYYCNGVGTPFLATVGGSGSSAAGCATGSGSGLGSGEPGGDATPEPASAALLGFGSAALICLRVLAKRRLLHRAVV